MREAPSATVPPARYAPGTAPPGSALRAPTHNSPTISGTPGRDSGSGNLDERLSRLESTVETLVRELRARSIEPRTPVGSSIYNGLQGTYGQAPATYYAPSNPGTAQVTPYGPQSMPNAAPAYNPATPRARSSRPERKSAPKVDPEQQLPSTGVTLPPRDAPLEDPQSTVPPTDGPVPQVASAPKSTLPAPPTPARYLVEVSGEEKELRQDVEGNIEDRLEEPLVDLKKQVELCETSKNRVLEARATVKRGDEAYKKGTTTLDLLLDAQRRLAAAEVEYAGSLANLKKLTFKTEKQNDSARLVAIANFRAAANAKSQALETWRHVHALFEKGAPGGEVEKETQAREQYFLFKEQTEKALAALRSSYVRTPLDDPRDASRK